MSKPSKSQSMFAKVLGSLIAIALLPMALLTLVGDTAPGGSRQEPDLVRGILGIVVGMLGLFLYGIGHYRMDHNRMTKSDHFKLTFPILVGSVVLIIIAILVHD